ncbi:hypothetical protein ACOME3_003511 [Neoechinorhynchus agilis]
MKVFITLALICLIVSRTKAQNQPSIKFSSTGLTEEEKVLLYEFMSESLNSPQGLRACITRPARLGTSCCKSYIARKVAEAVHKFDLPRDMTFCIEEIYETDSTTTTEQITSDSMSEATSDATTAESTVLSTSESTTRFSTEESFTASSGSTAEQSASALTSMSSFIRLELDPGMTPFDDSVDFLTFDTKAEHKLGQAEASSLEKSIGSVEAQILKIPDLMNTISRKYAEMLSSTFQTIVNSEIQKTPSTASAENITIVPRNEYQERPMNAAEEDAFMRVLSKIKIPRLS